MNSHTTLATKVVSAEDVLRLTDSGTAPAPFNLRVMTHSGSGIARGDVIGAGLYLISYRETVAYVGKFLGTASAPFTSDIRHQRWSRHIATLTLRGERLSIPARTRTAVSAIDDFDAEFRAVVSRIPIKDRGCVTSVNRVRFAHQHWGSFRDATAASLLTPFTFAYVRVTMTHPRAGDFLELRRRIEVAEAKAIDELLPPANEQVFWDANRVHSTLPVALDTTRRALEASLI